MCDDIFDESGTEEHVGERLWLKTKAELRKDGYREGLDKGQEARLQEGFNAGFTESARELFSVAELRGQISALLSYSLLKDEEPNPVREKKLQELFEEIRSFEQKQLTFSAQPAVIIANIDKKMDQESREPGSARERTLDSVDLAGHSSSEDCDLDALKQFKQRLKEILQ